MTKTLSQHIENGMIVSNIITDDAPPEEITVRDAIDQAIIDMNAIQAAALTTEASQITAIKGMSQILEKMLRFVKRRFL